MILKYDTPNALSMHNFILFLFYIDLFDNVLISSKSFSSIFEFKTQYNCKYYLTCYFILSGNYQFNMCLFILIVITFRHIIRSIIDLYDGMKKWPDDGAVDLWNYPKNCNDLEVRT